MEGRDIAISLEGVSFDYERSGKGGREGFISGMDLSIRKGAVTSLIGPNGCGKSTVLKLIAGILRPSAGSVRISGITNAPSHSISNECSDSRNASQAENERIDKATDECGLIDVKSLSSHKRDMMVSLLPQTTSAASLTVDRSKAWACRVRREI